MTTDQQRADALYQLADEIAFAARDECLSPTAVSAIEDLAERYRKTATVYGERSCKFCHHAPGTPHAPGCLGRNRARVLGRIVA